MDRRAAYRQILIVFLILMVLTIFEFRLAIVTEGSAALLFIAGLALQDETLVAAKVGVLAGSLVAAIIGMGVLMMVLPKPATETGS